MSEPIEPIRADRPLRVDYGAIPSGPYAGVPEMLVNALGAASLLSGMASLSLAVARLGAILSDAIVTAAVGDLRAEGEILKRELAEFDRDLRSRMDEMLRQFDRLERKLAETIARKELQEDVEGPAARIRRALANKREELAAEVSSFRRRVEDILTNKREEH